MCGGGSISANKQIEWSFLHLSWRNIFIPSEYLGREGISIRMNTFKWASPLTLNPPSKWARWSERQKDTKYRHGSTPPRGLYPIKNIYFFEYRCLCLEWQGTYLFCSLMKKQEDIYAFTKHTIVGKINLIFSWHTIKMNWRKYDNIALTKRLLLYPFEAEA